MTTLRAMESDTTPEATHINALRRALVDQLRERGEIRSDRVAEAFRAVPRHQFVPEASVEEAYANDVVITKRDERGNLVSSVSAPWIQAEMLEQSGLGPGMRALEIGSGGYNAALMAELVGERGEVITVDIDPEVTDRAQRLLAETGYDRVRVLCADGTYGAGDSAPTGGFDAVIVTAQASDVPAAWTDQLAANGRLVVPLSFGGMHRSVCFEREAGHLRSRELTVCGFVGMRGDNPATGHTVHLSGNDLWLSVDEGQHVDEVALRSAVSSSPQTTVWTGVRLRGDEGVLPSLDLWLVGATTPSGRVCASRQAVQRGLSGWTTAAAATWEGGTIAYMTIRQETSAEGASGFELGVRAYGPDCGRLAEQLAEQIRTWDKDHRSGATPVIRAYPAATSDDQLTPGHVIDKRHTRLVISTS